MSVGNQYRTRADQPDCMPRDSQRKAICWKNAYPKGSLDGKYSGNIQVTVGFIIRVLLKMMLLDYMYF